MEQQDRQIYRIGDYRLDPVSRSFLKGSERVKMSYKAFDMLVFLVQRRGEVVSKAELLAAVWPNVHVIPNNVDKQLSGVRTALEETADSQKYIETVHGEGVRFRAELVIIVPAEPEAPVSVSRGPFQISETPLAEVEVVNQEPATTPTSPIYLRLIWVISALVLLVGVIVAYVYITRARTESAAVAEPRQSYSNGLRALESGDALGARELFQKTVSLDSRFARAHAALSEVLGELGYEKEALEEIRKAENLSAGLGREDALFVKAQSYAVKNDWARCARTYETLFAFYPENALYGLRSALALSLDGKHEDAREALEAIRRLSVNGNPVFYLAEASLAEHASNYKEEFSAASQAEQEARRKGAEHLEARAELSEAWALDNLARLPEAELKAADAQRVFARLRDLGGEGKAWKDLGDVYIDQQRVDKAKSAYANAIERFHQIGYQTGEAVALNNLAYVLRDSGDLVGAGKAFEQSLQIARLLGDLRRQAMALEGVAIVLKRRGNLSGAEEANRSALEAQERLGDEARSATALNDLAIVLQDEGKLSEAEQDFQQALHLFQKSGRTIDVAMMFGNLGDLDMRKGDLHSAEENYRKQVDIGRRIPQPKQIGYGLIGLGWVAMSRCEFSSAKESFQESLRVRQNAHDPGTSAESELALAELAIEETEYSAADAFVRSASMEFHKERQVDQEAVSEAVLAEALLGEKKINDAVAAADVALSLTRSSEDKDSLTNVRLRLWKVLSAAGRTAEAVESLQGAMLDAEHSSYSPQLLEAKEALAQIRYESGDKSAERDLAHIRREASKKGLFLIAQEASVIERAPTIAPVNNRVALRTH